MEQRSRVMQVLNKIDLPGAEPQRVSQEIEEVGNLNEIYFCFFDEFVYIHKNL